MKATGKLKATVTEGNEGSLFWLVGNQREERRLEKKGEGKRPPPPPPLSLKLGTH